MEHKPEEIMLNKIAQKIINLEEGAKWFLKNESQKRKEILQILSFMILQAGSTKDDGINAIIISKLKKTYTSCVLLVQGDIKVQLSKIINLPSNEHEKSFILLITLFTIADERRRKIKCLKGCTHWWHGNIKDL